MAGHSHWAGIKHKKAIIDQKRGKLFSKLARQIMSAARLGGKDPDANPTLRLLIEKAKAANMPKENIEKAILKGVGELQGQQIIERTFEGYGPNGVALLVETITDNINRTTSEIRKLFSQHGGNLGESGCVAWNFKSVGLIVIKKETIEDEEKFISDILEAGAEDYSEEEEVYEITTSPERLMEIKSSLEKKGYTIETAQITKIADNQIELPIEEAKKVLSLIDALEDHEDVQNVYTNLKFTEELFKQTAST